VCFGHFTCILILDLGPDKDHAECARSGVVAFKSSIFPCFNRLRPQTSGWTQHCRRRSTVRVRGSALVTR
jgi:hypothetical protein